MRSLRFGVWCYIEGGSLPLASIASFRDKVPEPVEGPLPPLAGAHSPPRNTPAHCDPAFLYIKFTQTKQFTEKELRIYEAEIRKMPPDQL